MGARSQNGGRRGFETGGAIGFAALYGGLTALWYPYRGVFAFDPDEGVNAIKALLLERGHRLYVEIWSDQPPLFTHLLRVWLHAFGWDVDCGRVLVVLFGAACIFALYDTVRLVAGYGAAIIACLLLATSTYFTRLSVSLMLGVPAVALAMLALWALFRWVYEERWAWIAVAGVLMGCSLGCKLFTAVVLPVFAAWLVMIAPPRAGRGRAWLPAVVWLMTVLVTGGVLWLFLSNASAPSVLLDPHVEARRAPSLTRFGPGGLALTAFAEWPLTLLALPSYALIVHRRLRRAAVFPLWSAFAVAALLTHQPIWYHHQLLLSLPHCAAAGIAIVELFRSSRQVARIPAPLLMRSAAVALLIAVPLWSLLGRPLPTPAPLAGTPERILSAMRRFAASTDRVVATDPMYAFRAGVATPPALAAMPIKRVATDARLPSEIRAVFAHDPPEQVVLRADSGNPPATWIRRAMGHRYDLLVDEPGAQLFVRSDVVARHAH